MRQPVVVVANLPDHLTNVTFRPALIGRVVVYLALSPLAYAGVDGLLHDPNMTAALILLTAYAATAAYITGYSLRITQSSISFRRLGVERWKANFKDARAVQTKDPHYGVLDVIEVRSQRDDHLIGSFSKPVFHAADVEQVLARFRASSADAH